MAWGELTVDDENRTIRINGPASINDFVGDVNTSERTKNILAKQYNQLANNEIPRFYMQVRYGSSYSKNKHIRVYSYFADAVLFQDGCLWRDA